MEHPFVPPSSHKAQRDLWVLRPLGLARVSEDVEGSLTPSQPRCLESSAPS